MDHPTRHAECPFFVYVFRFLGPFRDVYFDFLTLFFLSSDFWGSGVDVGSSADILPCWRMPGMHDSDGALGCPGLPQSADNFHI